MLGSFLPDMPLYILTFGYMGYRRWVAPIDEFIFGPSYDALYFTNPWWIVSHNLFHAPLVILAMGLAGWWGQRTEKRWGAWLFWLALGCGFHSVVDILTHHNDGPLLLFPFNWTLRFISPVSYWDSAHYGNIFAPLEGLLDLAILVWMGMNWRRKRRALQTQAI